MKASDKKLPNWDLLKCKLSSFLLVDYFFKLPRATMSVFRGWLSLSLPAVTCRSSGVRLCKCRFLGGTMPTTDVSDQSQ